MSSIDPIYIWDGDIVDWNASELHNLTLAITAVSILTATIVTTRSAALAVDFVKNFWKLSPDYKLERVATVNEWKLSYS